MPTCGVSGGTLVSSRPETANVDRKTQNRKKVSLLFQAPTRELMPTCGVSGGALVSAKPSQTKLVPRSENTQANKLGNYYPMLKTTKSALFAFMLLLTSFVMGVGDASAQGSGPTVTMSSSFSSLNSLDPFEVTATFSEAVKSFNVGRVEVDNGVFDDIDLTTNPNGPYTLIIKPNGLGEVVVTIPAESFKTLASLNNGGVATFSVPYNGPTPAADTTPPTVSWSPSSFNEGGSLKVTLTFSEDVYNFFPGSFGEFAFENAAFFSTLTETVVPNRSFTLRLTPRVLADVEITLNAGAVSDGTNFNAAVTHTVTYTPPGVPMATVTTVPADTTEVSTRDAFQVKVTFTEPVKDFVLGDIEFTGGSGSNFESTTGDREYTLTFTPDGISTSFLIQVPNGVATSTSTASLDNVSPDDGSNVLTVAFVASTAPTVTLARVSPDTDATVVNGEFKVTATFSRPVTNFTQSRAETIVSVTNGAVLTVSDDVVDMDDGQQVYTLTIGLNAAATAAAGAVGVINIQMLEGAGMDGTQLSSPSNQLPVNYDTVRPMITLSFEADDLDGVGGVFAMTIIFSEPLKDHRSRIDDLKSDSPVRPKFLTLENANVTSTSTEGFSLATVHITPDGTGPVIINIPENVLTDLAGNGNRASTHNGASGAVEIPYTAPDETAPTVTLARVSPDTDATVVNGNFTITATFSESVRNFGNNRLEQTFLVMNGAVLSISEGVVDAMDGTQAYTVNIKLNLAADAPAMGIITIKALEGAGTDGTNDSLESDVLTVNYDISSDSATAPMVVSVTAPATEVTTRAPFTVTVTFSEPVNGFALTDINYTGGGGTALTGTDGDSVYTLTFTPSAAATSFGVFVFPGTVTSVASGLASVRPDGSKDILSVMFVQQTLPVLQSLLWETNDTNALTVTTRNAVKLIATFSKPVSGFDATDISIDPATVTIADVVALGEVDGLASVYEITISLPDDLVSGTAVTITPASSLTTSVMDSNSVTATHAAGLDAVVTYAATPLTVTLDGPATAFGAGNILVTATFSEVLATPATTGNFMISDGSSIIDIEADASGLVYTLAIMPPVNTDTTITVRLPQDAVTALASGVGNTASTAGQVAIAYDGTSPEFTVTFSSAGEPTAVSNVPFTVTAIAGEIVNHAGSTFTSSELSRSLNVDFTTGAFSRNGNGRRVDFTLLADGTAHRYPAIRTLPIPAVDGPNDISWQIPAGIVTDVAGNPNIASPSEPFIFTYVAPPTVKFTAPAVVFGTEPFEVQVNFEDASKAPVVVSNFVLADINFVNNNWAQAALTANSDRSSHRLVITPNNGNGDIVFEVQHRLDADTGNITVNGARSSVAAAQMTVRYRDSLNVSLSPAVPASVDSTALFTTTATFQTSGTAVADLAVTGFDANDVVITPPANATVEVTADTSSANVYTIDITPTGLGAFDFSINGEVTVSDIAVPVSTTPTTVTYSPSDTTAPRLVGLRGPNNGSNFQVDTLGVFDLTMTFSEPVQGFDINDLFFSPESIQSLTVSSTDQKVYTLTITPKTNLIPGAVMSITYDSRNNAADIDANNGADIKDLAVIPNPLGILTSDAITTLAATYAPPTTLTLTAPDDTPTSTPPTANGEVRTLDDIVVTATFSADVTGFDQNDIDINVAVSGVTTPSVAPSNIAVTGGPRVYTVTITPASTTPVGQVFTITPTLVGVEDEFNNVVLTTNANASVVTYAPTTAVLQANVDGNTIDTLDASYVVTVTFSRAVGFGTGDGFGVDDFAISDTLVPLVAANLVMVSATVYKLTVTPKSDLNPAESATLFVFTAAGDDFVVEDEDGFASRGAALASIVTYTPAADTTPPRLLSMAVPDTFSLTDGSLNFDVTVTFSEPVTGFDRPDLEVLLDGTVVTTVLLVVRRKEGEPTTGPASVYIVEVLPPGSVSVGTVLTIQPSSSLTTTVKDIGNNLVVNPDDVKAVSTYMPPDTTAPTLVSLEGPSGDVVEALADIVVTATFSEDVTGFDFNDIDVAVGGVTAPAVALAPSSIAVTPMDSRADAYTVTITPNDNTPVGQTFTISVSADSGITDTSVNVNALAAVSIAAVTVTYMPPDTTAPTLVSLEGPSGDVVTTVAADFEITATFSEPVTGFDEDTVAISLSLDGVGNPVAIPDGGISVSTTDDNPATDNIVYTVTITPDLATPSGQTFAISVTNISAIKDLSDAENALAAVSIAAVTVTYTPAADTTPPTLVSLDGPSGDVVKTLGDIVVTATFSEDVTGFDDSDIDVDVGGVTAPAVAIAPSSIAVTGGPSVYTVTITPNDNTPVDQTFTISVGNDRGITDTSVNENALAAVSIAAVTVTYDPPRLVSMVVPDTFSTLANFDVTVTFSEPVTGFDTFDLEVLSTTPNTVNWVVSPTTGFHSTYRVTLQPPSGLPVGTVVTLQPLSFLTTTVKNSADNLVVNPDDVKAVSTYTPADTTPPTLNSLVGPSGDVVETLADIEITATFSEDVTGFDFNDIDVAVGGVTAPAVALAPSSITVTPVDSRADAYTVTITPNDNTPVGQTFTISVSADDSGITDTSVNVNALEAAGSIAAVVTYTPVADTTRPVLQSLLGGPDDTDVFTVATRNPFEITATFSEAVIGFDATDLMVSGTGPADSTISVAPVSPNTDGSASVYTLTITPSPTISVNQIMIITQTSTFEQTVKDINNNVINSGTTGLVPNSAVTYDPPFTVTLAGPATAFGTANIEVTARFSEVLTTAPVADNFTISTGPDSITSITSDTSGLVYTLVITPPVGTNATIMVSLAQGVITTGSFAPTANDVSNVVSITYDGTPPTLTLLGPDGNANFIVTTLTKVFEITATFSEDVTGFGVNDLRVNADSGVGVNVGFITVKPENDGNKRVYTATIRPHLTLPAGTKITVDSDSFSGVIDAAGNPANNDPLAESVVTYTPDTTPPTLTFLRLSDSPSSAFTVENLNPFMIDAVFSEPVTGLVPTNFDVVLSHPSLTTIVGSVAVTVEDHDTNPNIKEVTFTPTADLSAGTVMTITTNASFVMTVIDGNTNSVEAATGIIARATYTPAAADTTPPTLNSLVGSSGNANFTVTTVGAFEITATFSEPVTGFDQLDIAISVGGVTAPAAPLLATNIAVTDGPNSVYTVTITPDLATPAGQTFTISVRDSSGITDTSVNVNALEAAGSIAAVVTYTPVADTTPPTVESIVAFRTDATTGGTNTLVANNVPSFDITVTFSEPVNGFDATDLTFSPSLPAGNSISVSTTDKIVHTATITPASSVTTSTSYIINIKSGVTGIKDLADIALTPNTLVGVTVFHTPPAPITVTLSGFPTTPINSQTAFDVTAQFSADVTGFEAGHVTITPTTGDTTRILASVIVTGSDSTYNLAITPLLEGTFTIAIAEMAIMNNVASTPEVSITYDGTRPTVTLRDFPAAVSNVKFTGVADFSENVSSGDNRFKSAGLSRINANIIPGGINQSGTNYTLTLLADGVGPVMLNVPENVAADAAGNFNVAARALNDPLIIPYMAPPTAVWSQPAARTDRTPFTITVTFSSAVTGFDAADVTTTNTETLTDDDISQVGNVYTLTVTPDVDGDITITIPGNTDSNGIAEGNVSVDGVLTNVVSDVRTVTYTPPGPLTVELSTRTQFLTDTADSAVVTATFSEPIVELSTGHTVPQANARKLQFLTNDPNDTNRPQTAIFDTFEMKNPRVYELTLVINGSSPAGDVYVRFGAGRATSAADSSKMNLMDSNQLRIRVAAADGVDPTLQSLVGPDVVDSLGSFKVTATFSEPVENFDEDDITVSTAVPNGVAVPAASVAVSTTDDNPVTDDIVYTVTITPATNTPPGQTFTISATGASGVLDLADNNLETVLSSVGETTVTYDPPPTLVSLSAASVVSTLGAFDVTVTFSEDVDGFDANDIAVTVSDVTAPVDPSSIAVAPATGFATVYTVTIMPASTTPVGQVFTISATGTSGVQDSTDNDLAPVSDSVGQETVTYTPLTPPAAPTVTLSGFPTTPIKSQTAFDVTAQFSADVTGFEAGHVTITPDASASVVVTGTGRTYNLAITPLLEGTFTIAIEGMAIMNNVASTPEVSVTFDETLPILQLTGGLNNSQTSFAVATLGQFEVTADFMEPVTGFKARHITASTGSVISVVPVPNTEEPAGASSRYTVTIEPPDDWVAGPTGAITIGSSDPFNGVEDLAKNIALGVFFPAVVTYDPPPTLVSLSAPSVVSSLGAFDVTVTFSEDVDGFDENDIAVTVSDVTAPVDPSSIAVAPATATTTGFATVYTVTIMPASTTPSGQRFTISATGTSGVQDLANNDLEDVSDLVGQTTVTYTPPTPPAAPTVTLSGFPTTPINSRATFDVAAQFSADVTGFEAGHVTITPDASASVVVTGSDSTYNLAITPLLEGTFTIAIAEMAIMNNVASTPEVSVTFDETRPVLQLRGADDSQTIAVTTSGQFEVAAVFTEPVTGFETGHITVSSGSVISVEPVPITGEPAGANSRYTVTIEPPDDWVAGPTGAITVGTGAANSSLTDVEDLATNTAIGVFFPAVATYAPPLIGTFTNPTQLINREAFNVVVEFGDKSVNFDPAMVSVTGGTYTPTTTGIVNDITSTTLIIEPNDGDGAVQIIFPAGTFTSAGVGSAAKTVDVAADTTKPVVTIVAADRISTTNQFTFVVNVIGAPSFSPASLTHSNADRISIGEPIDPPGNVDASYEITIEPITADTDISITLAAGAAVDGVGNQSIAVTHLVTYGTVDTAGPQLTLTGPTPAECLPRCFLNTREFEVTAQFSENVTGFTASHIIVNGASTATVAVESKDGRADLYTVTVTLPAGASTGNEYSVFASDISSVQDLAPTPNRGVITPDNKVTVLVTFDETVPTLQSLVGPSSGFVNTLGNIVVRATFSEVVSGFDQNDISVAVGGVDTPVDPSFTVTTTDNRVYTVTISPASSTPSGQTFSVIPMFVGVQDIATNPISDSTLSVVTTYDSEAPTLTLTGPSGGVVTTLLNPFEVTATFSEPVTGFDETDIGLSITRLDNSVENVASPDISVALQAGSTSVYILTITPPTDLVAGESISVADNLVGVTDIATNIATQAPLAVNVIYTPPAVVDNTVPEIMSFAGPYIVGSLTPHIVNSLTPFDLVVNFNVIPAYAVNAVTVANGDITNSSSSTDGLTHTLTITPTFTLGTTGEIVVTFPARIISNPLSSPPVLNSGVFRHPVPYDDAAPTLGLSGPTNLVTTTREFTITATFSEPVTGFDAGDLTASSPDVPIAPITVEPVSASADGSASVYTVTITLPENTPIGKVYTILANDLMGVEDLAGNPITTSDSFKFVTYDPPPTLVSLSDSSVVSTLGAFDVTVTFSKEVDGFDATDITVTPASLVDSFTVTPVNANTAGFATAYTVSIMPDSSTPEDQTFTISATGTSGVQDLANNDLEDVSNSVGQTTVTYMPTPDGTAPTLISVSGPNGVATEVFDLTSFDITVTFSEPVRGFTGDDVSVSPTTTNATMVAPTSVVVTPDEGVSVYTVTVTPASSTPSGQTFTILTNINGVEDLSTNPFASAPPSGVTVTYIDNTDPTLDSMVGPDGNANFSVTTREFEITATFSEDVTGIDETDFSATSPSITVDSEITVEPVNANADGSASVYTVTITLPETTPSGQVYTIFANNLVGEDLAGNAVPTPGFASIVTFTPAPPPTAMLTGPAELIGRANFEVTVTFDEEVSFDTTLVDVAGGTYTSEGTVTVTGTTFTHTLTIMPDDPGTAAVTVTLPIGAFTSTASSTANAVAPDSYTADPDITRPTLDSLVGPSGGDVDSLVESFEVTVTFSEPVVDFDEDDITVSTAVPNGVAVPADNVVVASTEGGRVYTVTITPALTTPVGQTFTIDVNEIMDVQDFANNGLEAVSSTISETTVTYVDTTPAPPTATLTGPAELIGRANFEVTVTFDEEVSFDTTLVDVAGGTYTSEGTVIVAATGAHTLTIMPAADTTDPVTVTLLAGAFTSTASNTANAVASDTHKADPDMTAPSIDTTDPSVMLTGAPDTATSRAPFTVTATFTEAVTGFEASDISVTNVAATRVTGRGANYVLTITPNGNGDIEITIPKDVAVDGADNGNTASELVSVTYDAAAPTVTLAGPDTLSNLEPFAVTLTFSEDVTGLEMPDIEVINGVVTTFSGSGANYVLTLTPTGSGDLLVTIPAAVAVDAVANGNTAGALAVVSTIVADTKAAIAGFMLDRANNLARNQPGLTRFLQGTGCGSVSTSLSGNNASTSGSVGGCVSRGQAWGEFSSAWSSDSFYTLATLGTHKFVRDDFIIGGMVQFDAGDNDARNITGRGWLAGPYFVSKPADQDMLFEGRLLYGQTDNDISPLGSYRDSFDTDRYLAQLRVTGQYGYRTATLMPLLDLTYLEDTQQDYTDTLNNLLDEQGIDLTQVTFGLDFKLPVIIAKGQLDLTGGLSGTYSEVNGGESNVEGGRGRLELGLNYVSDNGVTLAGGIFYDGISSDHESYGVNLSLDMKF